MNSQENFISLQNEIVSKFLDRNYQYFNSDNKLIRDNILYVFGGGWDFKFKNISIIYLNLSEVKKRIEVNGEFDLLRVDEIMIREGKLNTSLVYLTAKKNYEADFVYMDGFNEVYCVEFDSKLKSYNVYYCY